MEVNFDLSAVEHVEELNDDVFPPKKRARGEGNAGRCTKQSSKKTYSRKKKFRGNRYTKKDSNVAGKSENKTVSEKKIKKVKIQKKSSTIEGYRMMDMVILETLVKALCCPDCYLQKLCLKEQEIKKKGLASYLVVKCSNCNFTHSTYTSQQISREDGRGMKPFDVNIRTVYAFRNIGIGHKGNERYYGLMNVPSPMTVGTYNKISD